MQIKDEHWILIQLGACACTPLLYSPLASGYHKRSRDGECVCVQERRGERCCGWIECPSRNPYSQHEHFGDLYIIPFASFVLDQIPHTILSNINPRKSNSPNLQDLYKLISHPINPSMRVHNSLSANFWSYALARTHGTSHLHCNEYLHSY